MDEWDGIVDMDFPRVSADASEETISEYAEEFTSKIVKLKPDAVMCQSEFTLAFSVVQKLKEKKIPVVAACSERVVSRRRNGDTVRVIQKVFSLGDINFIENVVE